MHAAATSSLHASGHLGRAPGRRPVFVAGGVAGPVARRAREPDRDADRGALVTVLGTLELLDAMTTIV